jgi:hypothetical protein
MTPTCMEACKTLKPRLISCYVWLVRSSARTRRLLWLHIRRQWVLQLFYCKIIEDVFNHSLIGQAIKIIIAERGNSYSACDLKALVSAKM